MRSNQAKIKETIRSQIPEQRILILLLAICAIVQIFDSHFLSPENIITILLFIAIESVIAVGMTYLIILGEIDLSVGSLMSISCFASIYFQQYGVVAAILTGIALSTAFGLANGLITVKLNIPSMPVTLGTMVLISGLTYVLTGNITIQGENPDFRRIAEATWLGVPLLIYISIAISIVFGLILKFTAFGRNLYACGGNLDAAKYVGINTDRIRITVYTLIGALSGVAGVLLASKLNVASGLIGQETALMVITGVLLGGVSLSGGDGSVFKGFIGLLLMAVLNNSMNLMGVPTPLNEVLVGIILITVLAMDAVKVQRAKYL
jgi:ribose/xylose/arabinose/galactoside ABC-type transport system permease subunit